MAPGDAIKIVQDQILKIANDENGGLLALGMLGTIWSTSSAMDAISSTLNLVYDIQDAPDAQTRTHPPIAMWTPICSLPARPWPPTRPMRATNWVLGGLVLCETALLTFAKLRSRFTRLT